LQRQYRGQNAPSATYASSTAKQAAFKKNLAAAGHLFYQSSRKKIIYRKVCAVPKIEYSQLAKEAIFMNMEGTPSKATQPQHIIPGIKAT
jgi:uncharacterized pyridoxamine 5'-phosphate oxidase family protein